MNTQKIILLGLILVNSLVTIAQTKIVIRDLKGIEWTYDKRYSLLDSNEYFAYSFSAADLIDPTGKLQKLDECSCTINGDTVNIWINNNLAEGGIVVSIKLTNNYWKAYIQHYSDIEQFESGYFKNYQPQKSTLLLNLPDYKVGDILIGSIDVTAKDIETMNLNELTLKGKFQCVITKKNRR